MVLMLLVLRSVGLLTIVGGLKIDADDAVKINANDAVNLDAGNELGYPGDTTYGLALQKRKVRYYGTTDNMFEVEEMGGVLRKLELPSLSGGSIHVASVVGGMSSLALFAQLKYAKSISATFFDYVPGSTDLAKLYIELIKDTPTRHKFLEKIFARKLPDDGQFFKKDGNVDPMVMKLLFHDMPCDKSFADSVAEHLSKTYPESGALYKNEFIPKVACASSKGKVHPDLWPSFDSRSITPNDFLFGHLNGNTSYGNKVGTLWYNQAGFLKDEQRYRDTQAALRKTTFKFVAASLNDASLAFMRPAHEMPHGTDVVVFTSNALKNPVWVPDGKTTDKHGKRQFGNRLHTAFPHGVVLETLGAMQCWVFSKKCLTLNAWTF